MHNKLRKMVLAALMMALVTVVTILIHIPVPKVQGGYFNIGDSMIYIAGFLLGAPLGAAVGGIGSAIADALTGSYGYVLGTLVIKALMGLLSGFMLYKGRYKIFSKGTVGIVLSGIWMVAGYFLYETFVFGGIANAWLSLTFNLTQAAVGIAIAIPIILILQKIPYVDQIRKIKG